jgi:hypothetical protein
MLLYFFDTPCILLILDETEVNAQEQTKFVN